MLYSKNLRKLVLGLVVAAAASLSFAAPASADVFFDVATTTTNHPAGWLINDPRVWTTLQNMSMHLSGSDFGPLAGFTTGFLTFTGIPTGPTTLPSFTMNHTFSIYSGAGGTGTLLLSGTGTSTLTRTSSTSVHWTGDPETFTSAVPGLVNPLPKGVFDLEFTLSNGPIPPTGNFPQFVTFQASGSFKTVPEPSTLALLTLGGLGLGVRAYRRRMASVA